MTPATPDAHAGRNGGASRLTSRLKTRLRQLWQQCDLFDATAATAPPLVRPRPRRPSPRDAAVVQRLSEAYHRYNAELFGGTLTPVRIRISRRMKHRLGHYMLASRAGLPAEIAISWRHIRRDPWDDVLHTLVHEMVHQWQDAQGLPVDHGQHFRAKAREVGISARATRRATDVARLPGDGPG